MFADTEALLKTAIEWLRLLVEALGAGVIAVGLGVAIVGLIRHLLHQRGKPFTPIRLAFARYLVLALELQLAADILSTAVSPSWDGIGKLAAIALIRTVLNHFLNNEIEQERKEQDAQRAR